MSRLDARGRSPLDAAYDDRVEGGSFPALFRWSAVTQRRGNLAGRCSREEVARRRLRRQGLRVVHFLLHSVSGQILAGGARLVRGRIRSRVVHAVARGLGDASKMLGDPVENSG